MFLRTFGAPETIKYLHDTLIDSLELAKHFGVLMEVVANRPRGFDMKVENKE
jgi:hypothetical protein